MIIKLVLAIAIILWVFWYINKLQNMPAEQKKKAIYKAVMFALVAALLIGTLTGRMHWLGAVFAALIPMMKIGFNTLSRFIPLWLNHTGGLASFKTDYLEAKIHIQQGTVTGNIIKGLFEGQCIESLSKEELTKLEEYYKDLDKKSYYLIRYSQKKSHNFGQEQSQPPTFANPGREEALQILGLSGSPSEADIIAAHRRLINKVHPDKGGNDFLASRINQARDVLINK